MDLCYSTSQKEYIKKKSANSELRTANGEPGTI